MFRCHHAPERLIPTVQQVENAGFDELWVVEDCFFGGGIASATTALAASQRLRIGLGIMPAVARNPAFAAMEIATLARLYPGRFLPGFGHGVAEWMRQIGAFPASQLAALDETTKAVRALLRAESVTLHGRHANLDDVQLVFPPEIIPPISLGVRGPKSLALAGREADGTILAEGSSPAYIRWARQHILAGQRVEGRTDSHRVTVFMPASMHDDPQVARAPLRPMLADLLYPGNQQLEPPGILPELAALLNRVGGAGLADALPEAWFDQLSVSGTPDQCQAALERLAAAGANSVILTLPLEDTTAQIAAFAEKVLPRLR
ncbi:MAG: LLM class flavin-dependent oxidoreductase [Anaerolineae bacterium]|nr:LLM class flavin-dependent oxidoreductase [Anaerolineae bacterium]